MAVVQNPLIGRTKQKFSNAVFSTWKGINVLRSKPLTVANPKTDSQVQARNKLSLLSVISKKALSAIKKGFAKQAVQKSEANVFVQKNYGLVTTGAGNVASIDVQAVIFSEGQLGTIGNATFAANGAGALTVSIAEAELANVQVGNQVVLVAVGDTTVDGETEIFVESAVYTGGALSVDIFMGPDTYAWVHGFQYNPLTRESGNSRSLGEAT